MTKRRVCTASKLFPGLPVFFWPQLAFHWRWRRRPDKFCPRAQKGEKQRQVRGRGERATLQVGPRGLDPEVTDLHRGYRAAVDPTGLQLQKQLLGWQDFFNTPDSKVETVVFLRFFNAPKIYLCFLGTRMEGLGGAWKMIGRVTVFFKYPYPRFYSKNFKKQVFRVLNTPKIDISFLGIRPEGWGVLEKFCMKKYRLIGFFQHPLNITKAFLNELSLSKKL